MFCSGKKLIKSLEKSQGGSIKNLSLSEILNFPDEKLSDDARLIKNYFTRLIRHMPGNIYWVDTNGITLGCNDNVLKFVGVEKIEDVVGKSYEEIAKTAGWTEKQAMSFKQDDQEVIKTGKPKINVEEPVFHNKQGRPLYYLSSRIPLFDENNEIIGIVGISVDIADQKEKKQLQIEMEVHKKLLEERERYKKIAEQAVHDIRSPMASLKMIVGSLDAKAIPEKERLGIREALMTMDHISQGLLNFEKTETNMETHTTNKTEVMFVSANLMQLLSTKKTEYKDSPVTFQYEPSEDSHIAFIKIEPITFKRSLSNIINNAVDAFAGQTGNVSLKLEATQEQVKIIVRDNGKGMSPELVDKIMLNLAVTEGKENGHGIGLTQVRETLRRNQGSLSINSTVGQGTSVVLTFPRAKAPNWFAEKIELSTQDLVIILDDDTSIHTAWDIHFRGILERYPTIQLKHFEDGKEALDFINSLNSENKQKVFLLTDHELLRQKLNGLDVIEQAKAIRALLVTSHYGKTDIQNRAVRLGTRVLPKQSAAQLQIIVNDQSPLTDKKNKEGVALRKADVVIVDDDEDFAQSLKHYAFGDKVVDCFYDPQKFLKEDVLQYPKDTKICLDNNFRGANEMKGTEVAEQLHNMGYTKIFLLSGDEFKKGQVPSYLTAILKTDLNSIQKI